ncbi:hypothetical protein FRC01_003560 [Tulasnella sp. 417]|nr:hypothetical protein FRC01_003560 [Tulasnella sp. 417]
MVHRIQRPGSGPPSTRGAPGPPSNLGGKVGEARNSILSILKDTNWPKEASNDVKGFIETLETQLALDQLPNQGTEIPEEVEVTLKQLVGRLEKAKARLKKESQKYDPTKEGFRQDFKKLFSRNDPNECAEAVRSCRDDVVRSLATLNVSLPRRRIETPTSKMTWVQPPFHLKSHWISPPLKLVR